MSLLIEARLRSTFNEELINPLHERSEVNNTSDVLLTEIARGYVWHDGKRWKGAISSKVSKRIQEIGGLNTPWAELPPEIRQALAEAKNSLTARRAAILALLSLISVKFTTAKDKALPTVAVILRQIVKDCVKQFTTQTSGRYQIPDMVVEGLVSDAVETVAQVTDDVILDSISRIKRLLPDTESLSTLDEAIDVEVKSILRQLSRVADGVTSRLVASTRKAIAESIRSLSYTWVTLLDSRVRHDHSVLHGRVFSFDNPPVVDTATGRRCNPGEDYNCRCHPLIHLPE
jgi:SPP1 gp7 family putative phage head morphogenesis protein